MDEVESGGTQWQQYPCTLFFAARFAERSVSPQVTGAAFLRRPLMERFSRNSVVDCPFSKR